jgi:hypothetical protein
VNADGRPDMKIQLKAVFLPGIFTILPCIFRFGLRDPAVRRHSGYDLATLAMSGRQFRPALDVKVNSGYRTK